MKLTPYNRQAREEPVTNREAINFILHLIYLALTLHRKQRKNTKFVQFFPTPSNYVIFGVCINLKPVFYLRNPMKMIFY